MSSTESAGLPTVVIHEEGMREGMQIESADIPVEDKVRLLDALSATGLKHIVVGSFVSPKWVPQMARVEEVIAGFTPVEGVEYTALALNARGVERRAEHTPPLSPPRPVQRTTVHLCDVFVQRNTARTQADEIAALPRVVASAVERGITDAIVAVNAAWGSNWLGPFTTDQRMEVLDLQFAHWREHGVEPRTIWLGDPMSWNTPRAVEETLRACLDRFPDVTTYHLHLHDGRGSALVSAYQALRVLGAQHTLALDTSIDGMGGCPYCGNGRATRMIPTEDLVDLLEEEGIDTGVDLAALIEAAHLAEEVVGHELYGHVSKAGPRPRGEALYAMDMPFVETFDQAQHFRLGPKVYDGCRAPWKKPITSPARDAVEAGRPIALRRPENEA
ncbi:beta/alpha barrel domain-containing protein [Saccharomonospora glauca]|uniref:Isopropylmalate/homocitrate/citramalate synthase n=1 Tax=Saccharomonospora glauca K62 TaxID=928724 RepID=I1D2W5_9PSEU|nr:isopropylmalate/homocitrate/citramalate synthase [Saccharomonospora glauca]EIE99289.1 isopropylmalate/homocitrate/citramalate synthase [Saccharomonospora glauca K62]